MSSIPPQPSSASTSAQSADDLGLKRSRLRPWLKGAILLALVLVVGWFVPMHSYAITPGSASAVGPMVHISAPGQLKTPTNKHHGQVLMADVLLSPLNLDQWLYFHTNSNAEFVPSEALLGPSGDEEQLIAQGYLQMADSKNAARAAAFSELKLSFDTKVVGARIDALSKSGTAQGLLHVGDVVVSANEQRVNSSCGLIRVIHHASPGTAVKLMVRKAKFSDVGALSYGSAKPVSVTLGEPASPSGRSLCPGVSGPQRAALGVSVSNAISYRWPIRVEINTALIGGPSAGLAMTLQILDELSGGAVTHASTVAATGTMAVSGQVGDVGGVRQKAVVVGQAGSRIFLVPKGEASTARLGAGSNLHIVEVSSLRQALLALHATKPLSLSPAWVRAVA